MPVKPATEIDSWSDWPDDVRSLLRWMNHYSTQRLRFMRLWTDLKILTFVCTDCKEECGAHTYGAAVLDDDWLCDDCLIERARAENALVAEINLRFAGH
jgi:hypothetical protein